MDGYLTWSEAMERALYGPGGFYLGPGGPAAHFRTSVHASHVSQASPHASALFATAIVRLLHEVDEALGHPAELTFVDLAAGRGELVAAVVAILAAEAPLDANAPGQGLSDSSSPNGELPDGSSPDSSSPNNALPGCGSEDGGLPAYDPPDSGSPDRVSPDSDLPVSELPTCDPPDSVSSDSGSSDGKSLTCGPRDGSSSDTRCPARGSLSSRLRPIAVELAARPAELPPSIEWLSNAPTRVTGLILANEYLDNVPCDLVELTDDGPRQVLVAPDGTECLGPAPDPEQQAWLDEWWPLADVGERAEVGLRRDTAWRAALDCIDRGVAVAIDYSHTRVTRPPYGTLTGYAHGRQVEPVPDGTCDITAHVALDSCARAAQPPADWTRALTQRQALRRLGVTAERPEHAMASRDPRGYLRALARAGEAAELTASDGLGGFGWLVQGAGVAEPGILRD